MAALPLKFPVWSSTPLWRLDSLGLEMLPHPPYSPDLAPCYYHLFGPMNKRLDGQKFASDMEMQWAIRQWLLQQPTSLFWHQAFTDLLKDGTNV